MAKNLGIDLGTTNSCLSYLEGQSHEIIPNPEGSRIIPSVISLNKDGKMIFGNLAKRQFITHMNNTVWGVKRLIGRKYDSEEVKKVRNMAGYTIVKGENGDAHIGLAGKIYSPEEITSFYLRYLKSIALDYLGEDLNETVITVPAFFDDLQRQATKTAGEIAGLKVARIINEPTAALIAYRDKITENGMYAVYDLGGGTFDISIVEVKDDIYKVISASGDTFLGGNDFDERIAKWILNEIKDEIKTDLSENKEVNQRVLEAAEKAKVELSFNRDALISLPYLYRTKNEGIYHFNRKLSREILEMKTIDLVEKTVDLVKKSLEEIDVNRKDIEKVILVGGQSRMPLVSQKLMDYFEKEPFIDLNPEEVVAVGAAIQAELMQGKIRDLLLLDVTSLSLGVETKGDKFTKLIERNSTIPIKRSMIFTTISDNQQTVKIHVLQGEREIASENKSLGYFNLVGIPLAPKGEVTFEIDANGMVVVSAIDKQTSLSQSMKVQPAGGLSPEEIKKIIEEAKQFAEKDRNFLRLNELRSNLKEEYSSVAFFVDRYSDKISEEERNYIDEILLQVDEIIDSDDIRELSKLYKKLSDIRLKINMIIMAEFED